jgi:hypothetical protein
VAAGATAIGAMVSPFFVGLVADRFFATQRLLAVLHVLGGMVLYLASRQTDLPALQPGAAVLPLLHADDGADQFAGLPADARSADGVWADSRAGHAGWIVAGLLIGYLKIESTAMPMQIAAACSMLMGLYCLTLPHTPPLKSGRGRFTLASIFPMEAVKLLGERSMAVFAIASFLICIPLQFYYAFTNPFSE